MTTTADPFNLERFCEAQAPVIGRVLAELREGRKDSHWMWFVFPQAAGLGFSEMSRRYAIGSPDEAKAYLAHRILGPRLEQCIALVEGHLAAGRSLEDIFGHVDAMKYASCLDLFGPLREAR
jgi:uncharacterized protein (DUF1810 family)